MLLRNLVPTPGRDGSLAIPGGLNGPPGMVNGGIVGGIVSAPLGNRASVRLSAPVPLDTALRLVVDGMGSRLLTEGDAVVVRAEVAGPVGQPVRFRSVDDLLRTPPVPSELNPFSTCVVCGHARSDGLGVRPLHTGPGAIAAVVETAGLAGPGQPIDDVLLWGMLDCPSGFAALDGIGIGVLGTMTVSLDRSAVAGDPLVVTAERRMVSGRRVESASSLYTTGGTLVGRAETTWITTG